MKHFPDLDLVILRLIEAHSDAKRFVDFSSVKGHSANQIGYQIGLLRERGLIEAVDTRNDDEPNGWSAVGLTNTGHEHLKAVGVPSSDGTAQKESISESTSDGDDPDLVEQSRGMTVPSSTRPTKESDDELTLYDRLKRWCENNHFCVIIKILLIVGAMFLGLLLAWHKVCNAYEWSICRSQSNGPAPVPAPIIVPPEPELEPEAEPGDGLPRKLPKTLGETL